MLLLSIIAQKRQTIVTIADFKKKLPDFDFFLQLSFETWGIKANLTSFYFQSDHSIGL